MPGMEDLERQGKTLTLRNGEPWVVLKPADTHLHSPTQSLCLKMPRDSGTLFQFNGHDKS